MMSETKQKNPSLTNFRIVHMHVLVLPAQHQTIVTVVVIFADGDATCSTCCLLCSCCVPCRASLLLPPTTCTTPMRIGIALLVGWWSPLQPGRAPTGRLWALLLCHGLCQTGPPSGREQARGHAVAWARPGAVGGGVVPVTPNGKHLWWWRGVCVLRYSTWWRVLIQHGCVVIEHTKPLDLLPTT